MRFLLITVYSIAFLSLSGQDDVVKLTNPSFEDIPHQGGTAGMNIRGWFDCGIKNFRGESPPDIHPAKDTTFWGNFKETFEGETYLGLVARDNNTWESLSQKVSSTVLKDQCYDFSVVLSRNNVYLSGSRNKMMQGDRSLVPFTTPIVLRVWGGNGYCDTKELLVESPPIDHNDWKKYSFTFQPNFDFDYITLEAYYAVPVFDLYNGHILVDAFSDIVRTDCPEEVDIYAINTEDVDLLVEPIATAEKVKKDPQSPVPQAIIEKPEPIKKATQTKTPKPDSDLRKEKILTELDASKITKGQVIEIKNLFFAADTSSIQGSSEVLDEVYHFLKENNNVVIEIGGHTNNVPPHSYCDKLSKERAKSVADYLKSKGIKEERIIVKGYGKRNPIASNKTMVGRKKNQRVEIKILEV